MSNLIGFGLILIGGLLLAITEFMPLIAVVLVGVFLFASFTSADMLYDYVLPNSKILLVVNRFYLDFLPFTIISLFLTLGKRQLKIVFKEKYFKVVLPDDQEKTDPEFIALSRKEYVALRKELRQIYSTQTLSKEFMENSYTLQEIGLQRKKWRLIISSVLTALSLTMVAEPDGGIYLALIYVAVFLPMVLLWIPAYRDAKILHHAYLRAITQTDQT